MNSLPMTKELLDKINLLRDKDFLASEIALINTLRDQILNAVNRGEFVPYWSEVNELVRVFNSTIERLKFIEPISEPKSDEPNTENNRDSSLIKYKIDVKNVALHKGTDDKQMMLYITGNILPS